MKIEVCARMLACRVGWGAVVWTCLERFPTGRHCQTYTRTTGAHHSAARACFDGCLKVVSRLPDGCSKVVRCLFDLTDADT